MQYDYYVAFDRSIQMDSCSFIHLLNSRFFRRLFELCLSVSHLELCESIFFSLQSEKETML